MRILIVNQLQNSRGGQEIISQCVANGLHARGHMVTVLTTDDGDEKFDLLERSIRVVALSKKNRFIDEYLYTKNALQKLHKTVAAHEIILLNSPASTLGIHVLRACKQQTVYCAFHGKAYSKNIAKRILLDLRLRLYLMFIARHTQQFIFLTKADEKFFSKRLLIPNRVRPTILPNGIDTHFFAPQQTTAERTPNVFIVLFAGKLNTEKGVYSLLQAADRMHAQKVAFWFAGMGPLAQEIDKRKNCKLLGSLNRQQLRDAYARCNLVALPSYSECFPLTLLEGMAMGKPVLVSNTPNMIEIIHGTNNPIVQIGNPTSIQEAVTHLLAHPVAAKKLGETNHQFVQKKYTMESMMRNYTQQLGL